MVISNEEAYRSYTSMLAGLILMYNIPLTNVGSFLQVSSGFSALVLYVSVNSNLAFFVSNVVGQTLNVAIG